MTSSSSTSSSNYLAAKTASLTSQTPVPPSEARAAQIPLQSFNLPTFPPEAFAAGLTSLILTSDIKPDSYTSLLGEPFSIPSLPSSIKSLTLELFSLGYPPGFLTELGKQLPNLKSLTLYSQLFFGITPDSQADALAFMTAQSTLEECHLLDVFASPGFFTSLSASLSPTLKFLEINYTYRHSDPKFLASLPAKELAGFIGRNLLGLTMSISAPDITDDEDDREGTETGVLPVSGSDAGGIVERLGEKSEGLMMLDITMFELNVGDVELILNANAKLKVFSFTVGLDNGWDAVLEMVGKKEREIEVLDIVGVPGEDMVEILKKDGDVLTTDQLLQSLGGKCKKLKSLKVSIVRTKTQEWAKDGAAWQRQT